VIFEWDALKAAANQKKHRVAFEDAVSVSLDPIAITFADPDHSLVEQSTIGSYNKRAGSVCGPLRAEWAGSRD
jgi:uncharacterized DUF497 family protein